MVSPLLADFIEPLIDFGCRNSTLWLERVQGTCGEALRQHRPGRTASRSIFGGKACAALFPISRSGSLKLGHAQGSAMHRYTTSRDIDHHLGLPGDADLVSQRRTQADTWYVSYRSNILPKRESEERVPRGTRRFETEADAKQFALEVVRSGWSAIAGTINPHKPKQVIPSSKIAWIAERA
jgi:hypothetical protein